MRRWVAALVVALLAVGAACGGGGEEAGTGTLTGDQRLGSALIEAGSELTVIRVDLNLCEEPACFDAELQRMELLARDHIPRIEAALDGARTECLRDSGRAQIDVLEEYQAAYAEFREGAYVIASEHVADAGFMQDDLTDALGECAESINS